MTTMYVGVVAGPLGRGTLMKTVLLERVNFTTTTFEAIQHIRENFSTADLEYDVGDFSTYVTNSKRGTSSSKLQKIRPVFFVSTNARSTRLHSGWFATVWQLMQVNITLK